MITRVITAPADIRHAINTAFGAGERRIAVPFWGLGSIEALGLDVCPPASAKILCNLSAGGCNPVVIQRLIERGFQVRALASLHAKVYLGSMSAVLGSANASSDGLGLAGDDGWNEACVHIEDRVAVQQLGDWFDTLWDRAADLTDPHIARILLEQAERAPAGLRVDPFNLLDVLRANPRCLATKRVFVALDYEPYSRRVEKKVQRLRKQLGEDIDAWEDWTDMPPAAEILSFYYDRMSGDITFEGIYESPKDPAGSMDPETNGIYVSHTRRVLGTYELGDTEAWTRAVGLWRNTAFVKGRAQDKDLCLSLTDFALRYLQPPKKRQ